jgi:hypothetical protein
LFWGLHRGHLIQVSGAKDSPFGYPIDYFHLGHPEVVGYRTPYGRGTTPYPSPQEVAARLRAQPPGEWEIDEALLKPEQLKKAKEVLQALRRGEIEPKYPPTSHTLRGGKGTAAPAPEPVQAIRMQRLKRFPSEQRPAPPPAEKFRRLIIRKEESAPRIKLRRLIIRKEESAPRIKLRRLIIRKEESAPRIKLRRLIIRGGSK